MTSLKPPPARDTQPARPLTDHELLVGLMEIVSGIAADQRRILSMVEDLTTEVRLVAAETSGTSKAFHTMNQHLTAIKANSELTLNQTQTFAKALGAVALRVDRIEGRRVDAPVDEDIGRAPSSRSSR